MAYIIDETYFQREYYVPNVDELNSDAYTELMQFVDDKSRLLLKEVLGYELFKELDSYVNGVNLNNGTPQKWIDLVDGKEYTIGDETFYWNGLRKKEGAFKSSLITPYVFYYWLYYNQSLMSGVGEVVVNAKNAVNVGSGLRLTSVWNEFVNAYQGKHNQHNALRYIKNGVSVIDWMHGENDNFVSLIKFLEDNSEDYPNAALKRFKFKNQLGL